MNLPCLQSHNDGIVLSVKVTPKASRSKIVGMQGDALKILLHAPPAEGRANRELIQLLAKTFGVAKIGIEIIAGETSRSKVVRVRDMTVDAALERLKPFL